MNEREVRNLLSETLYFNLKVAMALFAAIGMLIAVAFVAFYWDFHTQKKSRPPIFIQPPEISESSSSPQQLPGERPPPPPKLRKITPGLVP